MARGTTTVTLIRRLLIRRPYYEPVPPRRGRRARVEDLERYLSDLNDELARVREEFAEHRGEGRETG